MTTLRGTTTTKGGTPSSERSSLSACRPLETMPDLSKPPSRSDDGDWQDAEEFEDVDCTLCDERLTFDECRALMDGWAYYESREDVLARATCGKCKRLEDGEDDEC